MTDIVVSINGAPVDVLLGENTALIKTMADQVEASAAETAAAQAATEAARDITLGASGPVYDTVAEGIATVADGATFRVTPDPIAGTAGMYRRVGASATRLYRIPTRESTPILPQFGRVYDALARGVRDVHIVIAGDSTTDATNEWPTLIAAEFHKEHPHYTFKRRPWAPGVDPAPGTYPGGSETTLETGSGAFTCYIWVAAVAGSVANLHAGSTNFNAVFLPAGTAPDLIMLSYGLNGGSAARQLAYFNAVTLRLAATMPETPLILIGQNPNRDDDAMAPKITALATFAGEIGAGFINVHDAFHNAGVPLASLFADAVHPNLTGHQLYRDVIMAHYGLSRARLPASRGGGSMLRQAHRLDDLRGYSLVSANVARVTTVGEWESAGEAIEITSTAVTGYIGMPQLNSNDAVALRGQWVVSAALIKVPAGNSALSGRFELYDGIAFSEATYVPIGKGWVFAVAVHQMAAGATALTAFLYANNGGVSGEKIVLDRVITATGRVAVDTLPPDWLSARGLTLVGSGPDGLVQFVNTNSAVKGFRGYANLTANRATEWTVDYSSERADFKQAGDTHARVRVSSTGLSVGDGTAEPTGLRIARRFADSWGVVGHWIPDGNAVADLGSANPAWRNLHLTGVINIDGQQVLGPRGAAVPAPAYSAAAPTKAEFDALVDVVAAMRNRDIAHGLYSGS